MFAPLVLKSVLTLSLFRWLTTSLCRTPVQTIRFNTTSTTTTEPSHARHGVSRIVRAIIGGVAALVLLAAGIVTFLWYQRRYNIDISSASYSSTVMESVTDTGLTPFMLTHAEATQGDPAPRMMRRRPQSRTPEAATANAGPDGPSSSPQPSGLFSRSFPIGLSAKELARMRAVTLRAQPTITVANAHPVLNESSQSPSSESPVAATEQRAMTPSPMVRTVQSQVDAERSASGDPPSYATVEGALR